MYEKFLTVKSASMELSSSPISSSSYSFTSACIFEIALSNLSSNFSPSEIQAEKRDMILRINRKLKEKDKLILTKGNH